MVALCWVDGSRDICYFMNISIDIAVSLKMKPKGGDDIPTSCSRTETLKKDSFIKGIAFFSFSFFLFSRVFTQETAGSFLNLLRF